VVKTLGLLDWLLKEHDDLDYTRGVIGYLVNYITGNPENQVGVDILDDV
jgi:hypothetical protein